MEGFTYQQMKDLQNLFAPERPNSDSSDSEVEELRQRLSYQKIGSGCSSVQKESQRSKEPVNDDSRPELLIAEKPDKKKSEAIWSPLEAELGQREELEDDPREVPEYEMKFRQAVGTEDVYLGMNFKTPATASCEWIALKVKLPGEQRDQLQLTLESNIVDLRTPKYRLRLPTPFPVEPNASTAKWICDTECLELALKLQRDLDDVNF